MKDDKKLVLVDGASNIDSAHTTLYYRIWWCAKQLIACFIHKQFGDCCSKKCHKVFGTMRWFRQEIKY